PDVPRRLNPATGPRAGGPARSGARCVPPENGYALGAVPEAVEKRPTMGSPEAAYRAGEGSALAVDTVFYDRLAEHPESRELVERFVLPIRSGRAWKVPAGHLCRISTPEGPQVGDLNIWNLHNPRERLWASRTRQLQSAHVTRHDRLWS